MALLNTITKVKTSTMRNTAKHWVRYQKTAMKGSRKKTMRFTFHRIKNVSRTNGRNLNNRRHKKLTKKLPKGQTTSPKDENNFEKVLIEKMEQHNWTLLIACKICKNPRKTQSLIQTISNSFHMVGRMINHVTLQITRFAISLRKCHSSDLIFKNNHGNPSPGELYYSTQSGQTIYDDTIFRDSHRSCSIKERS